MRYVCDLWLQDGNRAAEPYGMLFFENCKFPTQKELCEIVINNASFLKSDFIKEPSLTVATPGGMHSSNSHHYVAVKFYVYGDNDPHYLYPTNVRPVVEDIPNEIDF